jgi:hypothetical protein
MCHSCYSEWWSDTVAWYDQLLYCLPLLGNTKIHIKCNILRSRKLQYPTHLWSQRCWMSQILLYSETQCIYLDPVAKREVPRVYDETIDCTALPELPIGW